MKFRVKIKNGMFIPQIKTFLFYYGWESGHKFCRFTPHHYTTLIGAELFLENEFDVKLNLYKTTNKGYYYGTC